MSRAVEILGGLTIGLIAGSFLCAPLTARVFGPTNVTWNASACPPGIYTITATATSADGSRSYSATTAHIRLPRPTIVQEFGSLPAGQYVVTAVARDARGRTFDSGQQTVDGLGPAFGYGKRPAPSPSPVPEAPAAPVRGASAGSASSTASRTSVPSKSATPVTMASAPVSPMAAIRELSISEGGLQV